MLSLRWIWPLRLRQSVASRTPFAWVVNAAPSTGYRLSLAPTSLRKLVLTDVAHKQLALSGIYELPLSRMIARLAKRPGGLLVDVGANAGYFTCLWAALNQKNSVAAFEASPRNQEMLIENVSHAGFTHRVDIQSLALSNCSGMMSFDLGPVEQTGWGGLVQSRNETTVDVRCCRLDELYADDIVIDVLKIDVEGADAWVIEGAERLLAKQRIKNLFFERNAMRMEQLGVPIDLPHQILHRFNYQVRTVPGSDGETDFWAIPRF